MVDINDGHEAPRGRIEIRSGVERRRRWSAQEKGRIVAQAIRPGAVVAQVARRHGLTPQHLSNWVRAAKDGHFALPGEALFVPVVAAAAPSNANVPPREGRDDGAIEISIGAVTVRVRGACDRAVLRSVLKAIRP